MTNERRIELGYVIKVSIEGQRGEGFDAYVRRSVVQNGELDDVFAAVDEGGDVVMVQGWNCLIEVHEHA